MNPGLTVFHTYISSKFWCLQPGLTILSCNLWWTGVQGFSSKFRCKRTAFFFFLKFGVQGLAFLFFSCRFWCLRHELIVFYLASFDGLDLLFYRVRFGEWGLDCFFLECFGVQSLDVLVYYAQTYCWVLYARTYCFFLYVFSVQLD